ncbi:hypothetical protein F383_20664 [Gossypium arboreum]|uniref:Uncharacterized protein n=1 Tax=Gossypium arboreum TaxID=29729 RepID=A0A0B0NZP0_GOSAR|nr:hypothetical protein F383_20664 [Gossypium arboreum]
MEIRQNLLHLQRIQKPIKFVRPKPSNPQLAPSLPIWADHEPKNKGLYDAGLP